ncbi:metallophosphoesterase [Bacillus methanolicus]|uniref:Putative metallophosphoesterase YkuE n=1 Tax=Bacillus methanolicus (strain MGA3 / ATCC 53907) TaxID=796606 RepID=I3DYS3_BACMM|nr:metallophosphoesterase [Bacillus methanolicus]AIE59470.1 putative metallophosphoesterase YkuE [Bacillus methanolicus MGA3]EIJ79394.1 putative phosphohydrolase [Bacillus methanolicus MGA3]
MSKKVTRRVFLKKMFSSFFVAIASGAGGYVYAREVEPKMLKIYNYTFRHRSIPRGFDGFKIVQFSDTHLGFQYNLTQFEKLISKINSLKPDIIFFTGDLMDNPNKFSETDKIAPLLSRLTAPFGKFSIYGNHDHGGYGSDIYMKIMEQSDFTILQNQSHEIRLLDGSKIYIAGIDDAMLGKPDISKAVSRIPKNAFTILLSHAPDLADAASSFNIHLQLSGHSHGGQVQIPFFGALITPPFAEKYIEGFYKIGNSKQLTLYVNRGLGTTRMPYRFLSLPELTVFTLSTDL